MAFAGNTGCTVELKCTDNSKQMHGKLPKIGFAAKNCYRVQKFRFPAMSLCSCGENQKNEIKKSIVIEFRVYLFAITVSFM